MSIITRSKTIPFPNIIARPSATLHKSKSDSCASLGSLPTDLGADGAVIARESQSACAIGAGVCLQFLLFFYACEPLTCPSRSMTHWDSKWPKCRQGYSQYTLLVDLARLH